jgi:hypothetical protein
VDPRLGRGLIGLAAIAVLAAGGDLARAGQPDQPGGAGPPPAGPPPPNGSPPPPPNGEPIIVPNTSGPILLAPPAGANAPAGPPENAPSAENAPAAEAPPAKTPAPKPDETKAAPPPGPPAPPRGPMAILQVLDKVTAETLKFEAPIGRRVRYKTLVFTVRVCETRGPDDPQPRPSAYVVVDSEAPALPGRAPPPAKEVFRGWMFANAPGLHPLEHPIYDAWLVACSAADPANPAPAAAKAPSA